MSKKESQGKIERVSDCTLPCCEHCLNGRSDHEEKKTQISKSEVLPQLVRHAEKKNRSRSSADLFSALEAIAAHNAPNYNKSSHQD